jgi:hypothetical protein
MGSSALYSKNFIFRHLQVVSFVQSKMPCFVFKSLDTLGRETSIGNGNFQFHIYLNLRNVFF